MNIDTMIDKILDSYEEYGGINCNETNNFPNRQNVVSVLQDLQSLIFPGFRMAENLDSQNIRYITGERVNRIVSLLTQEIRKALLYVSATESNDGDIKDSHCFRLAEQAALALIEAIPELRRKIQLDTKAALAGDPAAKSIEEVIVSYPGLESIVVYRIAHYLHSCGVPVIPRIMSEYVHGKTGIDIHPGAEIGESFFIDHGTGVVIGETTVIGKNVQLYQGVTLGALSVKKELSGKKRHPTLGDDVTVYSGATILGGDTVIGDGSTIGGNTWVTHSVPAHTTLTQDSQK